MSDIFLESSLSDSVMYQSFNGNAEMTKTIITAIKDSIVIDASYIEEQIMQIRRTKISPLAETVLSAFEDGSINLLYSKIVKVPKAFPFFVTKVQGKIKVFIFVNNYGTISKSDLATNGKYLNITMKDLYVLMEGAYCAYKYTLYPTKITKNLGLMKLSCNIYTSMILRILNKEYSLSMDQTSYAKVSFCISKFFLERVWMSQNHDINFSYSFSCINTAVNKAEMLVISEMYDAKNIMNIKDLIMFIKEISPRLQTLTIRYFTQCYINLYKAGAMFSLECLPYFIYTIEATLIGSFLVNQPIISDITKNIKGMNTFYSELVKSVE